MNTSEYAELIKTRRPEVGSGTVRIFGEWFGGRPYDAQHTLVGVRSSGNQLELRFKNGESLKIWDPKGLYMDDYVLRIEDASRVLWEWFPDPKRMAESRAKREYKPPKGDGTSGSVDPNDLSPNWDSHAIEIWVEEYGVPLD
jgi:hypothetical protein